jgi:hypothetical protein
LLRHFLQLRERQVRFARGFRGGHQKRGFPGRVRSFLDFRLHQLQRAIRLVLGLVGVHQPASG